VKENDSLYLRVVKTIEKGNTKDNWRLKEKKNCLLIKEGKKKRKIGRWVRKRIVMESGKKRGRR
jgi:DNA transposition AAA+ family ATPase